MSSLINIESLLLKMKNRRLFVIVSPIVLGLLAGGILVVKPQLNKFVTTKAEVQSLKEKESAYNMILEGEKRTGQLAQRFIGDKTWLIEQVNTIAQNTGFSIVTILPDEPKKIGDFLDRTSVRIEAEGDYHELGEFVSRIESLDAYIKIVSLDISAERPGAGMNAGPMGPAPGRGRGPVNIYTISMSVGLFTPASGTL